MAGRTERTLVRILIGAALCVAVLTAALTPISALPAVALGQQRLFRLEVALLVFYGILLLVTPAFLGLTRGRLPIDISTRGEKFAEDADRSTQRAEAVVEELEQTTSVLIEGLEAANFEIEQLKKASTATVSSGG